MGKDTTQLRTTDGMCIDDKGNIWVADFSANAVARIDKDGKFSVLLKALTVMAVTEVWISRANLSYGTDR